jgi:hypothetical protein
MGRLPEAALAFQTTGQVTHEVATGPLQERTPEHTIKFAVIGLDHNHINGITDTIRRSGGWGYAVFDYEAASDTFTPGTLAGKPPQGNDAKCGFACHTRVKTRDYVFTDYGHR